MQAEVTVKITKPDNRGTVVYKNKGPDFPTYISCVTVTEFVHTCDRNYDIAKRQNRRTICTSFEGWQRYYRILAYFPTLFLGVFWVLTLIHTSTSLRIGRIRRNVYAVFTLTATVPESEKVIMDVSGTDCSRTLWWIGTENLSWNPAVSVSYSSSVSTPLHNEYFRLRSLCTNHNNIKHASQNASSMNHSHFYIFV